MTYLCCALVSLHFNYHFSRWTCVSRCLVKLRMMEVVVMTGATRRAWLHSDRQHRWTNTQYFPSVLWCCWLGDRKGIRPVETFCPQVLGNTFHTPWVNSWANHRRTVWTYFCTLSLCCSVAESLGRWTCDQQVTSLNPGLPAVECNPEEVVNTHVPLSPSSIIWYQSVGGDALRLGR